jgi:hypothetical protein
MPDKVALRRSANTDRQVIRLADDMAVIVARQAPGRRDSSAL